MSDLHTLKAESACRALAQLNPHVQLQPLVERLTAANAVALVRAADLVIDAADSFAVTYILSDSCQAQRVPLISASVLGLSGYVGAFCGGAPSYRAVFPDLPQSAGSCAEAGVLGSAVGVIGTLQAHMALGVLIGWQPSPLGRLLSLDLRTLHLGGFSFSQAGEPLAQTLAFIAPADVVADDVVVDLRSHSEAPQSPFAGALRLDVAALEAGADCLPSSGRVVLCCRSGLRAWRAARALQRQGRANLVLLALGE